MNKKEILMKILCHAQLAPSFYNTQPWQIKINQKEIYIVGHRSCTVPVSDFEHRNLWLSLGVLVEILEKLFLLHSCQPRFQLLQKKMQLDPTQAVLNIKYNIQDLKSNCDDKKYIDLLLKRRTYRHPFRRTTAGAQFSIKNTYTITQKQEVAELQKLYAKCQRWRNLTPGFIAEARRWTRLSRQEPGYGKDGLDFKALAMNSWQRNWAKIFMNPWGIKSLKWLGLNGKLNNESRNFKNASGIVVKVMDNNQLSPASLIHEGRLFFNTWLELTTQEFEACPIPLIIDYPIGQNFLKKTLNLSHNTLFSMAMRYGKGYPHPVRHIRRSLESWAKEFNHEDDQNSAA